MAVEIERKFLCKEIKFPFGPGTRLMRTHRIEQGYLNTDPSKTVRVRIQDDTGFITVKGSTSGWARMEYEYAIPYNDAVDMMRMCTGVIKKIRYVIRVHDTDWEVDVFEGDNAGLVIAEVEMETETDDISMPDWLGEEVTNDYRYSNSNLSNTPYCMFN